MVMMLDAVCVAMIATTLDAELAHIKLNGRSVSSQGSTALTENGDHFRQSISNDRFLRPVNGGRLNFAALMNGVLPRHRCRLRRGIFHDIYAFAEESCPRRPNTTTTPIIAPSDSPVTCM